MEGEWRQHRYMYICIFFFLHRYAFGKISRVNIHDHFCTQYVWIKEVFAQFILLEYPYVLQCYLNT